MDSSKYTMDVMLVGIQPTQMASASYSRRQHATSARMVHVHVHAGHVSYKVYTCNTNIADQIKFKTAR